MVYLDAQAPAPESGLVQLREGVAEVLRAESPHPRGLTVTQTGPGGYDVRYWYGTPREIFPSEIDIDGRRVSDSARVVHVGYHAGLSESGQQADLPLEAAPWRSPYQAPAAQLPPKAKFWPEGPWLEVEGYTVAPHKWGRHGKEGTRAGYTVQGHARRIGRRVYEGFGGPAWAARSAARWGREALPVPEYPAHPIPAGSASHQDRYEVRLRERDRRTRKWRERWGSPEAWWATPGNTPAESGFLPAVALALPALGKLLADAVITIGIWLAADWAISELSETEQEIDGQLGAPGSIEAQTSGVDSPMGAATRAQHRAQIGALEARGEAMLTGPRLTIYRALVADSWGLMATPAATSRAASTVRALLFRYTLKHGNCDAFPEEREWCLAYRKRHAGGSSTAQVPTGAPGGSPGGPARASWILPAAAVAILGVFLLSRQRKG